MAKTDDHDSYIAAAPEPLRPLRQNLRALLSRTLPDAEEIIAYNMPGYAGAYVSRIASSPSRSLATSRSGGRVSAK